MNPNTALFHARTQKDIADGLDGRAEQHQEQGQPQAASLARDLAQVYRKDSTQPITSPVASELAKHLASPNQLRASGPVMDQLHAQAVQEHGTTAADAIIGELWAVKKHGKNS